MTKTWFYLSVFIGAVFILAILGCDGKIRKERQAESDEKRAKIAAKHTEALSRFGSPFNAEVFNDRKFGFGISAYSIHVEKALIREDGKPVVFWSRVDDISKSTGEYLVHFHNWVSSIHYSLKCQENLINLISENTSQSTNTQFAVVAVIDSVKRIDLIPSAEPTYVEGEPPSIELTSGWTFWAKGRCLALKPKAELLPDL